jgi:hypothetical protein
MTEVPKLPDGRTSWKALTEGVKPGDVLTLPAKYRHQASSQLLRMGYRTSTHVSGNTVTVTFLSAASSPKKVNGEYQTAINQAEARHANIGARIREALENALYWQRQAELRTLRDARLDALARQAAWKMTATRLQQQLSNKTATP